MSKSLRVAMAQLDMCVGAVVSNADRVSQWALRARDELSADVIVFPELTLTGYPPEDLLWRPGLRRAVEKAVQDICAQVRGIDVVLGYPVWSDGRIYNAAALIRDGEVKACYYKHALPNYSVFDEQRYFSAGTQACVVEIKGFKVGLTVCEDIWVPVPAQKAKEAGAELIFNINASPFHQQKYDQREQTVMRRVKETGLPVVYVNSVGGQDELVFDGMSFVLDAQGQMQSRFDAFTEELQVLELNELGQVETPSIIPPGVTEKLVYQALVVGVRDYITKNRFKGAVIGSSGGVDSALTLAVAVDALGAENVEAVMMPSRYTRDISLLDAQVLADNLGVDHRVIPIEKTFNAFLDTLSEEFSGLTPDVTEENIQARCRGTILMAISNKKGKMVLTTGNKSEMAMGYSTLYGDMAGGFNVLKDVSKTLVYRLCNYRNSITPVIPQRILDRAPSAELAPDQTDQDSLPPYDILDAILERYVERDESIRDIIAAGFDSALVRRVVWALDKNEYKRRQAPPGVKITPRAFGKDRRYPITSGYSEVDQ